MLEYRRQNGGYGHSQGVVRLTTKMMMPSTLNSMLTTYDRDRCRAMPRALSTKPIELHPSVTIDRTKNVQILLASGSVRTSGASMSAVMHAALDTIRAIASPLRDDRAVPILSLFVIAPLGMTKGTSSMCFLYQTLTSFAGCLAHQRGVYLGVEMIFGACDQQPLDLTVGVA